MCPWAGEEEDAAEFTQSVHFSRTNAARVRGLKANGHKMRRTGRVAARYINKAARHTILHPGVLGNTQQHFYEHFFTAAARARERKRELKAARGDAYLSFVIRIGAFLQH